MFGQRQGSAAIPVAQPSDPNELLRRIDQQTTMIYHWVRAGVVVIILLLVLVVLIG